MTNLIQLHLHPASPQRNYSLPVVNIMKLVIKKVGDDDGDESPSSESWTDSRSALPMKNGRWSYSFIFTDHQSRPYRIDRTPEDLLVQDSLTSTNLNSNSIYSICGEKNQRGSFIVCYDKEPPPSPTTSGQGWSGVRSRLRRGESVAIVIINLPPSPISWCSPSCVSNSIVGLLGGDGLDEICHVIELVLLGFDP